MFLKRVLLKLRHYACLKPARWLFERIVLPIWNPLGERSPSIKDDALTRIFTAKSPLARLLSLNKLAQIDADRFLAGRLCVFGKVVDYKNDDFSWHQDICSKGVFPFRYHARIPYLNNRGIDIVVPWEMSRLQFIPTLIQAHRESGRKCYVEGFRAIISHWHEHNPPLIGVNWKIGMESAIRGMNLALGILYFWEYLEKEQDKYRLLLWNHVQHIYIADFKRDSHLRNNHYLVSCAGLLFLANCFTGKVAHQMRTEAMNALCCEVESQFDLEGVNAEGATAYHALSLESALLGLCCLESFIEDEPSAPISQAIDRLHKKLSLASSFTKQYLDTYGRSPQFGDSSDGRILFFHNYYDWDPRDHEYILQLAKELGVDVKISPPVKLYSSRGYGFYKNEKYGICLNASQPEEGLLGGHNHCDKGSFVLSICGQPVLVDSGTYCYTPFIQKRDYFKKTSAHNTLTIDGYEQASFDEKQIFCALDSIKTEFAMEKQDNNILWEMTHDGFSVHKDLGVIGRTVTCSDSLVHFEESIEGHGEHLIEVFLNLEPGLELVREEKKTIICKNSKPICTIAGFSEWVQKDERSENSAAYSASTPSTRITFSSKQNLPIIFSWDILVS